VEQRLALLAKVKDFQKKYTDSDTRPTFKDHSELLASVVSQFSRVYLVIDALDECADIDDECVAKRGLFVSGLKQLQSPAGPPLHLFITSRPLPEIEQTLEGAARLDICANSDDITSYVNWRILNNDRLAHYVNKDPALQAEITGRVLERCRNVYVQRMSVLAIC
jgi:ankyrin repeat domain-containing protein 50